jgi:ketosteroid isomerase-like protein
MPPDSAESIVRKYVARINAHDVPGLLALCAPDHVFIDSLGKGLSGLAQLEQGWSKYFGLFPDYRIEVDTMISADPVVLMSGWASATHRSSGASWHIPAAWRAVLANERVAEWQVYADNKLVYEILGGDG